MSTVLIADDNDDLRYMLGQLLQANGYLVLEAADGPKTRLPPATRHTGGRPAGRVADDA